MKIIVSISEPGKNGSESRKRYILRREITSAVQSTKFHIPRYSESTTWKELSAAMIQCPGFVSIVRTRKDDFVPETTPGSVSKVTWQVTSADTLASSRESDISPLVFSVMPKLQHERHTEGKLERFSKISFGFARKVAFKTVGGANAAVRIRYPAHDTDETRAARRIQAFFIDILRRQRHAIIPALASLRASYFQLCLKQSRSRTWESTVDRVVFLALWPHALACLEAMRMQFQLMKDRASNRLQHASHQDLEDLGANTAKIQ